MNNGQINIASTLAALPFIAPVAPGAAVVTMDGGLDSGANFAGLLSGLQKLAQINAPTDPQQAEQAQIEMFKNRLILAAASEKTVVDVTTQLNTSPGPAVPADSGVYDPEETASECRVPSDLTSQMALAAYVQPGRTAEVTRPALRSDDRLQNSSIATEISTVTVTPAASRQPEQHVAVTSPSIEQTTVLSDAEMTVTETVATQKQQQPETVRTPAIGLKPVNTNAEATVTAPEAPFRTESFTEVSKPAPLPVDRPQNAAMAPEKPISTTQPAVIRHPEQNAATPPPSAEQQAPPPVVKSTVRETVVAQQKELVEETTPEAAFRAIEIKNPTPLPVDRQQNAAVATDRPAVTITPEAIRNREQNAAAPSPSEVGKQPATPVTESSVTEKGAVQKLQQPEAALNAQPVTTGAVAAAVAAPATATPEAAFRTAEVKNPTPLPVDMQQNAAMASDRPAVTMSPEVIRNTEQNTAAQSPSAGKQPTTPVTESPVTEKGSVQLQQQPDAVQITAADVHQAEKDAVAAAEETPATESPEITFRTAAVNKPAPLPVDGQQNAAMATYQPAVSMAPEAIRSPEQNATTPSPSEVGQLTAPGAKSSPSETVATQKQQQPEAARTETADLKPEKAAALTQQIDSPPVSSQESELEIQLSLLQPIPTRVAATAVSVENNSVWPAREQIIPEQRAVKLRPDNSEVTIAKGMSPMPDSALSPTVTAADSDDLLDSNNHKQQSEIASGNRTQEQQMSGQAGAEQPRFSSVLSKTVPAEPDQQKNPEQIVQQLKEHFSQQTVKPGNQQITLTLSPDGLGELKLNLNLQGQKLSVEIVTENRAVRDVIVQHTDALKESLARQNITMESFDVTTGGKGSGNQGQNQNAWRELTKQQQEQQFWASSRSYAKAQADLPSVQAVHQRQRGHSMLDIHY